MKEKVIILDDEKRVKHAQECAHHNKAFNYCGALYWIKNYRSRGVESCGYIDESTINELELTVVKIQQAT